MHKEYTVDYFIDKFEAIPENKWCIGTFTKSGYNIAGEWTTRCCAFGHCGETWHNGRTEEAVELDEILKGRTEFINDGGSKRYNQYTPKRRILAALYDVKNGEYA